MRIKRSFVHPFSSDDLPMESRVLNFVCIIGCLAVCLAIIARLIEGVPFNVVLVLIAILIGIVATFLCSLFHLKYTPVAKTVLVYSIGIVAFPVLYYSGGSENSSLIAYFILAVFLDFILLKGKTRVVALVLTSFMAVFCYRTTMLWGWDIGPELSMTQRYIEVMQSFFITSFLIGFVVYFHAKVFYEENAKADLASQELKRRDAELEDALQWSVQASTAKGKFLATMSHEIRTPMNAILGIAEIQLNDKELTPKTRDALNRIYSSGNLLLSIVNDILDISKIESGKFELIIGAYQIASLINDSVQMNTLHYESKPIKFHLTVNGDLPATLSGDELRIKQIVNNILSNAFKYTDKGDIHFSVNFERSPDTNEEITLIFNVRDTGQGMTKDQIERLFDEYSRFNSEANRRTIGTGLGMNIAHKLVTMMNGTITVESTLGKGSVFEVRLPQKIVGRAVIGKELKDNLENFRFSNTVILSQTFQLVRDPMPYGRVLLVDDMESNLYVGKGLLTPYEIKVETALSGFDTINRIRTGQVYDIIFMDHMMPGMDGIEATKILRKMGYKHPIVALTANAIVGQAEIFLENGFDAYISKPIDTRQLNQVLNKYIRDKQRPEVIAAARSERHRLRQTDEPPAMSKEFINLFLRDAGKSYGVLNGIYARRTSIAAPDIQNYIIHIHAAKSALANIGEKDLSKQAAMLEEWSRHGNYDGVFSETPEFLKRLREVMERLSEHVTPAEEVSDDNIITGDTLAAWEALRDACYSYEKKAAKEVLSQLKGLVKGANNKKVLDDITTLLLHSNFDEAAEAADQVIRAATA